MKQAFNPLSTALVLSLVPTMGPRDQFVFLALLHAAPPPYPQSRRTQNMRNFSSAQNRIQAQRTPGFRGK